MTALARQAGYTLSEMLAALLILGLAMGGLVEGGLALSHLQATSGGQVRRFVSDRNLQRRFASLLEGLGPARTGEQFRGSAQALRFACGSGDCGAELHGSGGDTRLTLQTPAPLEFSLGPTVDAHFVYVDADETVEDWPQAHTDPPRLQAVLLVSGDGRDARPLASARIWRQEQLGCSFDDVIKDCRTTP